jgi:predicted phage terminase large subunit-like protein
VTSEWFTQIIGERWQLRADANRDDDWWTTSGGRRFIASPDGGGMGQRCTMQIIDDALSGRDIYSRDIKIKTINWINEVLSSRFEDRRTGRRVLIGQRLVHDDPFSEAERQGWTPLVLPLVLEADDAPCEVRDDHGSLVWRDPRQVGQSLDERWPPEAVAAQKQESGSRAFAAQFRQRPFTEEAAFFRRAWFGNTYTERPRLFDREVIALDASFKAGDASDYAVIQAWGSDGDDRYLLEQWRRQAGFVDTLDALRAVHSRHPHARVLVEAAANGHAIIDQLERELGRGVVEEVSAAGGKKPKWSAASPICERGSVRLPANATWLDDMLDEITRVPDVEHDDQADAMAIALLALEDVGNRWPDYVALRRRAFR